MRDLTVLLEEIVQQTFFEVGQILIAGETTHITFGGELEKFSSAQLHDILERAKWDDDERLKAETARPVSPDHLAVELDNTLCHLMADYIVPRTNHIRHAFPAFDSPFTSSTLQSNGLCKYEYVSTVSEFAKGLTRAAAILGSDRAVKLLCHWIARKPLRYRTSALLVGVTVEQELDLRNGVRVTPLPVSSDALPVSLPGNTSRSVIDYLGRVTLSVDSTVCPVLSKVRDAQRPDESLHVLSDPGVASLHTLCEALSIICDSCVRSKLYWNDYGEVSAFSGKHHNNSWRTGSIVDDSPKSVQLSTSHSTGVITLTGRGVRAPNLSIENLQQAWNIHGDLDSRQRNNRRFKTAVSRWIRSTRPDLEVIDQFIELRIALEALYLDGDYGEQAFRLAIRGAWHLGEDFSQRQHIQEVLKKFYRVASKVVHGEVPNETKGDLKWLKQARDLCRRGILKVIKEKTQPDWNKLTLGHEIK